MQLFLARQPIFDRSLNVAAYELLYRSDPRAGNSVFSDGNSATSEVITQSMMVTDFSKLTNNKKAFINFTGQLILDDIPLLFDHQKMVVEVLEDVDVSDEMIDALKKLKESGYTIALDDLVLDAKTAPLIPYADIIKVDFMLTTPFDRLIMTNQLKKHPVKLLAEKVETRTEFDEALKLGYDYFQGYFFAKPDLVVNKDIKPLSLSYLRIMEELSKPAPEYNHISEVIESDVSLAYKLLRLVNSPSFYRRSKIKTINQALVLMGMKELKKWVALLMLRDVASSKPDELVTSCLIRGKMMERMATTKWNSQIGTEAFLVGLMSLIDVMTDRSLAEVIRDLPLEQQVVEAIVEEKGGLGELLTLVKSYEQGDLDRVKTQCDLMKCDPLLLPHEYFASMEWVDRLLHLET